MEESNKKNFHRRPHHRKSGQTPKDNAPTPSDAAKEKNPAHQPQQKNSENSERTSGTNNQGQNRNHRNNHHNKHRRRPQNNESTPKEAAPAVAQETINDIAESTVAQETLQTVEPTPAEPEAPKKSDIMVEVVGIRFKASGKTYYFDPAGISAPKGSHAIVDTARGLEYGEVSISNTYVSESDIVPPLRPVVRIATEADNKRNLANKEKEQEAFVTCNERIMAHGLDMKLIDAQYTFDNSKLLFYFTSSGRVDFRELVKDLASVFKTRIELRQIGIRDEAKLIGGLGMCGRSLCCSLFLSDFGQVSIKMAKEQNLSLNSTKISGICGRLMCCLRYEHETYEYEIKRTPPVDSTVKTEDGIGTVTEISPLAGTVKVRLTDKPDQPPKSYHRDNVTVISKK